MKYFSLSLLVFIFVLSASSSAFAALTYTNTGNLTLGGTNTVVVPLSPGVTAGYDVGDWKGTDDWFVVGAYHKGGSKVYATASSISKLWQASVAEGAKLATTFATVPTTYDTAGSDDVWSAAGWDL